MKKMMILVSTIMMVATGNAKENVETKPFEGVNVNVPACVRFVSGDKYEMNVRSTDSIAEQNIQWTVENGVLKINSRHDIQNPGIANVCITIVSPVEPRLTVGSNYEVSSRSRAAHNLEQGK
jgi:protein gp37